MQQNSGICAVNSDTHMFGHTDPTSIRPCSGMAKASADPLHPKSSTVSHDANVINSPIWSTQFLMYLL